MLSSMFWEEEDTPVDMVEAVQVDNKKMISSMS